MASRSIVARGSANSSGTILKTWTRRESHGWPAHSTPVFIRRPAAVKRDYAIRCHRRPYARKHRLRRFDGEYRWVETRAARCARRTRHHTMERHLPGHRKIRCGWEENCVWLKKTLRVQASRELGRTFRLNSARSEQPLAAIVANSHACQRWLSAEPPNIQRAKITTERITRDANSAADVVSRIRALFRQSVNRGTARALWRNR